MEFNSVKRLPNILFFFLLSTDSVRRKQLSYSHTFLTRIWSNPQILAISSFKWIYKRPKCHPTVVEMTIFSEKLQKPPGPQSVRCMQILSFGLNTFPPPFEKF